MDILALDEALTRLTALDPELARVVELRYFGGLTIEQIARILDKGKRSIDREWACAKAWLYRELALFNLGDRFLA